MSNFADGLFPRYLEFMVLLPFIMLGFGLWFIGRAFSDRRDSPDQQDRGRVTVLPDRTDRPLYHVHQQIRASARPRPKPGPEEAERESGGRSRGRPRHGTRLVVRR